MPYKKFINALNNSKVDENGVRIIQRGYTIYLCFGKETFGVEQQEIRFDGLRVDDKKITMDNKVFFKYNYINILKFEYDELKGHPIEIFKLMYLYKYKLEMLYAKTLEDCEKNTAYKIIYNLTDDLNRVGKDFLNNGDK